MLLIIQNKSSGDHFIYVKYFSFLPLSTLETYLYLLSRTTSRERKERRAEARPDRACADPRGAPARCLGLRLPLSDRSRPERVLPERGPLAAPQPASPPAGSMVSGTAGAQRRDPAAPGGRRGGRKEG